MKLLDALRIINAPSDPDRPTRDFILATGFTPLALETFFHAELRERVAGANVRVSSGRFGDLPGNLERATAARPDGVALVIEWADIDPRLGMRGRGTLTNAEASVELLASAEESLTRLQRRIAALAEVAPVAVALPTLPLPPYFLDPSHVVGATRLKLHAIVAAFAATVGALPRVRVADVAAAGVAPDGRDVASELHAGFPYKREHASRVAAALAHALWPAPPRKGLITDLDDTLWRGILGEVGIDGVSWTLEQGAQVHMLYQQVLANLMASGVLVAVATKNDPAFVQEAFKRTDFVVPTDRLYPVRAGWGRKSVEVAEILRVWNIGADSVVFVDDSPLELAEVTAAHPGVEGLRFQPDNPAEVVALLERLAAMFGRDAVRAEDLLRAESIRNAAVLREAVEGQDADDVEAFLGSLGARLTVTINTDTSDARAFELVNKTNQFNINGRRYGEAEWHHALERPGAFLATVSYEDKFGPLGKIAIVTGARDGDGARIESWVLSCRAFARRIEHATMDILFERLGVDRLTLDFVRTPRNGPSVEFAAIFGDVPETSGDVVVTRARFAEVSPTLYHARSVNAEDAAGALGSAGGTSTAGAGQAAAGGA
ncbi:MAG: HAD-IIIC family phosphatase [Gemmatimonadetes bacterium]|nr:HAD-IIIC family phosphatase [Gemmatimonadota bacterium]